MESQILPAFAARRCFFSIMNEAKSGDTKSQPTTVPLSATSSKKRGILPGHKATVAANVKSKADSSRMDMPAPLGAYKKVNGPAVQPDAPSKATSPPVQSDAQAIKAASPALLWDESLRITSRTTELKPALMAVVSFSVQPPTPSEDKSPTAQPKSPSKDVSVASAMSYPKFELIEGESNILIEPIDADPARKSTPIKCAAPISLKQLAAEELEDRKQEEGQG